MSPPKGKPALILGCQPGPGLRRRTEAALRLHAAGDAPRLVFSGFRGEARWGADLARAAGVPEAAIALEEQARSTWQNLIFSWALLDEPFWLVSDPWHLPRAALMARKLGLPAEPYPTAWRLDAMTLPREALALGWAGLRGRLY